jgi:hypothetical protein
MACRGSTHRHEGTIVKPCAEVEANVLTAATVLGGHVNVDGECPWRTSIGVAEMDQHHLKRVCYRRDHAGHESRYSDHGLLAFVEMDLNGGWKRLAIARLSDTIGGRICLCARTTYRSR